MISTQPSHAHAPPRKLGPTLVTVAIISSFVGMPHSGFAHLLLAPILLVWAIYACWSAWRKPAERRHRAAQMMAWAVALSCTLGLHAWHANASRDAADAMVAAVNAYRAERGVWPQEQQEVGSPALRADFHRWRGYYRLREGEPTLFYWSTWEPFSAFHYDFAARRWEFFGG